jgi:hypothetical protein
MHISGKTTMSVLVANKEGEQGQEIEQQLHELVV